ncbi:uncharacterized protein N7511_010104 [Penicillium nucicola]|uniref:uncharacterized protein n=1 Tax=Penicillium nucicola TaxID=1850975 RepID=UPI002545A2EC|nr:uncharacterized protein N7511_010104 [Penicillium nucicola]KAJ5748408.1 hypothetical protein N7511_010104 [Penicillium nucicola]
MGSLCSSEGWKSWEGEAVEVKMQRKRSTVQPLKFKSTGLYNGKQITKLPLADAANVFSFNVLPVV